MFCFFLPQKEILAQESAQLSEPAIVEPPKLGVPIPGLQLGSILAPKTGLMEIPFLAQYVAGVARYLISISVVAAAIMIVYGGFLYTIGSTGIQVKQGKEIVIDAIIGLLLLLGTYTILKTINPELVTLKTLNVPVVKFIPIEQAWFTENGTSNPSLDNTAAESAGNAFIPSPPRPDETPFVGEAVSIAKIDTSQLVGAPAKLQMYCPTLGEVSEAKTYEQKIQLLVRVVLGWKKVCVDENLCIYCQTCGTALPNGPVWGTGGADFILRALKAQGILNDPRELWSAPQFAGCLTAFRKNESSVNTMSKCTPPVTTLYKKEFIDRFNQAKLYGSDCNGFRIALYNCARSVMKQPPIKESDYFSAAFLGKLDSDPSTIIHARTDEDLMAIAAKKGGMKFGDIVYTNSVKGGKLHWAIYTGGRPDVPFSFLEMGGKANLGGKTGGVLVPGLKNWMSGVTAQKQGMTIQDYVDAETKKTPGVVKSNGDIVTWQEPKFKPHEGIIFVWRPYEYQGCASKAECKEGESCFCTQEDSIVNYPKNTCHIAKICHAVKSDNLACVNDEHCAVGYSCKRTNEKSSRGKCKKD